MPRQSIKLLPQPNSHAPTVSHSTTIVPSSSLHMPDLYSALPGTTPVPIYPPTRAEAPLAGWPGTCHTCSALFCLLRFAAPASAATRSPWWRLVRLHSFVPGIYPLPSRVRRLCTFLRATPTTRLLLLPTATRGAPTLTTAKSAALGLATILLRRASTTSTA